MQVVREIEAEMRAIGLWDGREGTFERWLQDHLATPKPLGFYERAHDEWVKWGPEDDGPVKLLGLLRRLDRVLEFRPAVLRFGFYSTNEGAETPGGFKCVWGRPLSKSFRFEETSRVAWQLEMEHEPRERMLMMALEWTVLQLATNALFAKGTHRSILPGDWKQMAFAESYGWSAPGRWTRGRYQTTVSYWGEPIANDEFTIE